MIKRETGPLLKRLSSQYPVVTVTGPRQSGKTTLARSVFPGKEYANLEAPDTREFAKTDPRGFLKHYGNDLIIDEIQRVPELLSYIQVLADKNKKASFILTGSQQFEIMKGVTQSLAGRTALIKLLPFSIAEAGKKYAVKDADALIFKGFYPGIYDRRLNPYEFYSNYSATYIERDLRQLVSVKNLGLFEKFLRLCAGRTGNILNSQSLASDAGVSHTTVREWLSILEASYIVFLLKPWHGNISKRLVKSPKMYFYDVGLASWLLGIENEKQVGRDPLKGALFENMVVSEFMKYRFNGGKSNNLYFYRDSKGNEIDLICLEGRAVRPVEIKAGATVNDDCFKNLRKFKEAYKGDILDSAVIYGGDDSQNRDNAVVRPFYEVKEFLDKTLSF